MLPSWKLLFYTLVHHCRTMQLRKTILLVSFTGLFQYTRAQNLVPNGSFEDENICEYHQNCSPSAWFYATKNANAGYFINEIPASTGTRWLSIVTGNRQNKGARQYWQTMLLHNQRKKIQSRH